MIVGMTIDELAARAGGIGRLADIAGVKWSTVCGWKRTHRAQVPVHHAKTISKALDVPLHLIRPDIWSAEGETSHCGLVSA